MTFESDKLEEISAHNISKHVAKWMESEIVDFKDRVIAIALSGGLDSVCLLLIFKSLGYELKAVHCNFGLRGQESESDSTWCSALCTSLDIPLITKRLNASNHAKHHAMSIQESARILRYDFFSELHDKGKFDLVALGHHLDDSIESLFINLFRGTGIRGLKGIPARRNFFIRPLIKISKPQLQAFAEQLHIEYREDSSNEKDVYLRNQIRLNLLPEIEKIQPKYRDIFNRDMNQMEAEAELLDQFVAHWKEDYVTIEDDRLLISKAPFIHLPNPALLFHLVGKLGFNWKTCADLVSRMDTISGKVYQSVNHEILVDRHQLIVRLREPMVFDEFVIHKSEISKDVSLPSGTLVITELGNEEVRFTSDSNIEYVDAAKLDWPLHVRKREAGEKFQPMGMKAKHKKIKDYLIDEKVNLFDKENLLILCDEKNIIWLIGKRLDRKFRVLDDSKSILKLEYHPNLEEIVTG